MEKDGHYINSIYLVEYFDKKKIPEYDQLCSSMADNYINHLCSEVSLTKRKPRRPKKTETTAKEVCLTKHESGRPKKTDTMIKKQKTK
ncbi:14160_t:CDS:2 [Cetraspora pellucida]|uniref:14160_t:CDS:1 n=1 Tax=Cetraspora pellucida TaxID=1433469 RepID=A0A9N9CVQ8_9GLOM|nr:14160_t:CDS:2 [Cetraspora pellucida]